MRARSFPAGRALPAALLDLTRRIQDEFVYDPRATTITTPVGEVLAHRRGVCQDFAHLMISCLRSLGLSARYVSGYILTYPPPGKQRLAGADASHAWVEAYCPGVGWIAFDPTNGKIADLEFVTLGWAGNFPTSRRCTVSFSPPRPKGSRSPSIWSPCSHSA